MGPADFVLFFSDYVGGRKFLKHEKYDCIDNSNTTTMMMALTIAMTIAMKTAILIS